MLSSFEKEVLDKVTEQELDQYLDGIIAYERLAGSQGETLAAEFIHTELKREGIDASIRYVPALLSNPIFCRLEYKYNTSWCSVPAKTRSFAGNTDGKPVEGKLIYIAADELPSDLLSLSLGLKPLPELTGKVVLSETVSPAAILACAKSGASGFIQWWQGTEEEIHEGIFNPVWGTPLPGEQRFFPAIPVAAVNYYVGGVLKEAVQKDAKVRLVTVLDEAITDIPVVEAIIRPAVSTSEFLLIGNHIDSWYYGATDNGTGNAAALMLAKLLYRSRNKLRYGAKVLWWSGHSNGRYAGSSFYAQENFHDLNRHCLAYMNIDMPGLRGANDYSKITAGMDLFELAQTTVYDTTQIKGQFYGPVRGWDQSFQNVGISSYFIWASTLPVGHPDTTNDSFMSWWWHTEQDIKDYYEPKILCRDTQLYLLAALRLLGYKGIPFNITSLLEQISNQLEKYIQSYSHIFDFKNCQEGYKELTNAFQIRMKKAALDLQASLYLVRKLNRMLFVERDAYMQDYAVEQAFLPGFMAAKWLEDSNMNEANELMLRNYLHCQANRFSDICYDIIDFLQYR